MKKGHAGYNKELIMEHYNHKNTEMEERKKISEDRLRDVIYPLLL